MAKKPESPAGVPMPGVVFSSGSCCGIRRLWSAGSTSGA